MIEFEKIKALRMNSGNNAISMKQRLDTFYSHFCEFGFAKGYLEHIGPLLDLFPDTATEGCIFETCLDDDEFFPDFSLHFNNSPEVKGVLLEGLPEFLLNSAIWSNIKDFIKEWREDEDLKDVINLWLEFDMPGKPQDIPVPGVFFRIDRPVFQDWMTDTGLKKLNGKDISSQKKEILKKCFYHLPEGALVAQLGLMHSRASKSIRAYIRNIEVGTLYTYLNNIGYTGEIPLVKSTFEELFAGMSKVNLQLDVGEAVLPEIAFEFKHPQLLLPVLDYMEKNRLCTSRKKELVTSWTCKTHIRSLDLPLILIRYISHLKISLCSDRTLKAKAYIGLYYS